MLDSYHESGRIPLKDIKWKKHHKYVRYRFSKDELKDFVTAWAYNKEMYIHNDEEPEEYVLVSRWNLQVVLYMLSRAYREAIRQRIDTRKPLKAYDRLELRVGIVRSLIIQNVNRKIANELAETAMCAITSAISGDYTELYDELKSKEKGA